MKNSNSILKFIYKVIPLIFLFSSLTSCNKEQNKIKIDLTDPQYAPLIAGAFYVYDKNIVICPSDSGSGFIYHAAIRTCPYCGVAAIAYTNANSLGFLFACSNCLSLWYSSGTPLRTPWELSKPLSLPVYPCTVSGHILTISQ
jgi:hypothetical protein